MYVMTILLCVLALMTSALTSLNEAADAARKRAVACRIAIEAQELRTFALAALGFAMQTPIGSGTVRTIDVGMLSPSSYPPPSPLSPFGEAWCGYYTRDSATGNYELAVWPGNYAGGSPSGVTQTLEGLSKQYVAIQVLDELTTMQNRLGNSGFLPGLSNVSGAQIYLGTAAGEVLTTLGGTATVIVSSAQGSGVVSQEPVLLVIWPGS